MFIIGCDYHPSVQQIAWVETETGECGELRLKHIEPAEQFYRELKKKGVSVRVGMEATGHSRWFERLLGELNYELWVGDPAQIRAKRVRKQRNDRFDAQHILKLMLENNFPGIWVPTPENRDVRQLVLHRHRLVGMRTRVMNQLQAIAMNEGIRRKRGLWTEKGRAQLESLQLPPWTNRRRQELLQLLDRFDQQLAVLKRRHPRPWLGPLDRLFWVLARRLWSVWKQALLPCHSGQLFWRTIRLPRALVPG